MKVEIAFHRQRASSLTIKKKAVPAYFKGAVHLNETRF